MNKPNIFTISHRMNEEDIFTYSLHYLIDNHPDIGQAISDFILENSGMEPQNFLYSTDHPVGTQTEKPDFMLSCEKFDIICEHKLNADLGNRQLQRYLALERDKQFVLALISNGVKQVPDDVLSDEKYLNPIHTEVNHFRWQSLFPIIERFDYRLSNEFIAYMIRHGMKPIGDISWRGLFDDSDTASVFGQLWDETLAYFKGIGASCKLDAKKLSIQVSRPSEYVHLLFPFVSSDLTQSNENVIGPYIGARLYIDRGKYSTLQLQNYEMPIVVNDNFIYQINLSSRARWNKNLECIAEYACSLDPILNGDNDSIRHSMLDIFSTINDNVNQRLINI